MGTSMSLSWQLVGMDEASGALLLTHPDLDWDNFPALAISLLDEWELALLQQDSGADRHSWQLTFEESRIWLHFEHHSGCWLSADDEEGRATLRWLSRRYKD
ncbi:DUF3630 family protein [Aeromonas sp. BIGb0445]|jgi:hypothetical protein|uniref:DUF3630 family protein n=1 Tax=Aeromonas sp. BIGb0445 TaxID=2940593 RepID=UPI00216A7527|nr:DUF3630 family protein [Aeromonas sp. BIGb0445]MCS3460715.1 hypothetical protein [Aeromonas sp. BIGb0445]